MARRAAVLLLAFALLGALGANAQVPPELADYVANITADYVHPFGRGEAPDWKPITALNYATYLPGTKDWAAVISGCRAVFKEEKRLMSMTIRIAFHDAFNVDLSACKDGNTVDCAGADSSVLLSTDEMVRPENGHDGLADRIKAYAIKLASFYGISVADVLAVCSTVAIEDLSGGRLSFFGGADGTEKTFRVGRIDYVPGETDTPPPTLPGKEIKNKEFAAFWKKHNITLEEGVALLGSHSVLELQDCRTGPAPDDVCDPEAGGDSCKDLRRLKWNNHYYHEVCSPKVTVINEPPPEEPDVETLEDAKFNKLRKATLCHWSGKKERANALKELLEAREGNPPEEEGPADPQSNYTVTWSNDGCERGQEYGVSPDYCPHAEIYKDSFPDKWFYTTNDAFLGQACASENATGVDLSVRNAMRKMFDQDYWDTVFKRAWIKVLTQYATWPLIEDVTEEPTLISGKECKLYNYDKKCGEAEAAAGVLGLPDLGGIVDDVAMCGGCGLIKVGDTCDKCCKCQTGFNYDGVALSGRGLLADFVAPITDHLPVPDLPGLE